MAVYQVEDMMTIARLFHEWENTMIYSCLQGYMGEAYTMNLQSPNNAAIKVADFSFLVGKVDKELLAYVANGNTILVPADKYWEEAIKKNPEAKQITRYALKKKKDNFDIEYLKNIVEDLDSKYALRSIDEDLYVQITKMSWASDLCSNYKDYLEYSNIGLGFVILDGDKIVAGASSYTRYKEGIEIEIDTNRKYRRRGLALICGAKLILECIDRGLYPSWDAHNIGSLTLAKKLGYHYDKEYDVYEIN